MESEQSTVDQVVEVLGRVPLFQGLPRTDLERIAGLVRPREIEPEELVFREGDPGDRFYIIFTGAVEILKERPRGDHERLAVKRSGEAFGEMSLLTDAPRSASVRAIEPTRILTVSKEDFASLLGGESIALRLMRSLAKSLRALDVRFAARETGADGDALRQFSLLLQRGLLPREAPTVDGFQLMGGTARGSASFGNSLWDSFGHTTCRLAVMDVKGTELPPGHLLSIARALVREVGRDGSFDDLLTRLSGSVFDNLFEGLDECVEVGVLEISDGQVKWSAAGDQPAVLVRGSGDVEHFKAHGPPLGILPRFDYDHTDFELASGDVLLVFSEAEPALVRGAIELVKGHADEPVAALGANLEAALGKVKDQGDDGEDVSFIVVRRS